ncbi:sigma-54 interaction domain-containing protein [Bryocella elongata]|nr:sigma-54 dependent transcriptional regulator [Bryocella elongata]
MSIPIGSSPRFQEVLADVRAAAPTECSVLLHGETGTGKEVIARAIHAASTRSRGPYVALNCAAVPATLFESELFGHERGAFTGAVQQTTGRILAADGGSLFLDEIGDMPLDIQPKLLRALQEKCFERLGSPRSIRTNTRVIAATNRDLAAMVEKGLFRADLFYRLNVFPISLPPLRERREDIQELSLHFLRECARAQGKTTLRLPDPLLHALRQYHWPGNIRELQNFIERAVIVSQGDVLTPRESDMRKLAQKSQTAESGTLDDMEKQYILRILHETGWLVGGRRGAAAKLGIPRTTLISKMHRFGIARNAIGFRSHLPVDPLPGAVAATVIPVQ